MSFLTEAIVGIRSRARNLNLDPNFEASLPHNLTGEQLSRGIEHFSTLGSRSAIIRTIGVGIFGGVFLGHPEAVLISIVITAAGHLLVQEAKGRARILRHLREDTDFRGRSRARFLL